MHLEPFPEGAVRGQIIEKGGTENDRQGSDRTETFSQGL